MEREEKEAREGACAITVDNLGILPENVPVLKVREEKEEVRQADTEERGDMEAATRPEVKVAAKVDLEAATRPEEKVAVRADQQLQNSGFAGAAVELTSSGTARSSSSSWVKPMRRTRGYKSPRASPSSRLLKFQFL